MTFSQLNKTFMSIAKRAEQVDKDELIRTFVDVGALYTLLSQPGHQVVFGRRGTGKTHALSYLAGKVSEKGDLVIFVDLRNVGSTGGIWSDDATNKHERATRLLVDCLSSVHSELRDLLLASADLDPSREMLDAMDGLSNSITSVKVVGESEITARSSASSTIDSSGRVGLRAGSSGADANFGASEDHRDSKTVESVVSRRGLETHRILLGDVSAQFRKLCRTIAPHRIWVILDEWSSTPRDLQPYLAELLKRTLMSVPGVVVKIAAIEHRSVFRKHVVDTEHIGLELGADVSAEINLDDFVVMERNKESAVEFFSQLIFNHVDKSLGDRTRVCDPRSLIGAGFTQQAAFEEFVKASEGVARDAINILSLCAQAAADRPINVAHVRIAARRWYEQDKSAAISSRNEALDLLHWLISEVIKARKARAFLFAANKKSKILEYLYDNRLLHVLRRNVSSPSAPGERYVAYKLDYGCYADLIATNKAPTNTFCSREDKFIEYIERGESLPEDDNRSINRAILDIDIFYQNQSQLNLL